MKGNGQPAESRHISQLASLVRSPIYRAFAAAFRELTGYRLVLLKEVKPSRSVSRVSIPIQFGREVVGVLGIADTSGVTARSRLTQRQHSAALQLVEIFADHLALLSSQFALRISDDTPPQIQRAKAYIEANHAGEISLANTARHLNVSRFYFSKLFKSTTGVPFSRYVAQVRVEQAKRLLASRHRRVSEIAFEVGFQSLTSFNRTFRKIIGHSPTHFRRRLGLV